MFGFPPCRSRYLVRLGMGHADVREAHQACGYYQTPAAPVAALIFVENSFFTITQPPLNFSDQRRCYRQQKSTVKLFAGQNERREMTEAFPRRSSYTRLFL